jgi:porin
VVLNSEAGFSLMPSATWGGNIKYKVVKGITFDTGAFEVNPTTAASNGLDWSTKAATGYTIPVELTYESPDARKTRYPEQLKVGGYLSTGDRVDPFFNAANQSAALTGTKQRNATSLRSGIYAMGEKTVWRPDPRTPRGLTLFGAYIQPLEQEEIVDTLVYGGAVFRGPFQGRMRDSIGFSAAYLHVSPKEIAYLRDNRTKLHGGGEENPNEFTFELNYGVAVGHSIRVTPNMQYVVNPDNASLPKIAFVPKNILTFGVKMTANLATMIGLPSTPTAD